MAYEAQFIPDFDSADKALLNKDYGPFISLQFARPDVDITDGAWLASTGSSDLYTCIDEASYNDTDYIFTRSLGTTAISLSSLDDPSTSSDHIIRYRAKGDGSTDLIVRLKQGTTTIATWTETNVATSETTFSHTLTSGEADSITDYSNLTVEFEAA
jgi:hypothetical protein